MVLLLLAASPCTAPFAVCDLADASHSDHAPTRHLTHASAVVRPAANVARPPILLSRGTTPAVTLQHQSDDDHATTTAAAAVASEASGVAALDGFPQTLNLQNSREHQTGTGAPPPALPAHCTVGGSRTGAEAVRSRGDDVNQADTAWMLISTALVLLMTPALAFFYGGLVRSKNALNTMMMSFISLGFVGVLWATVGYSLAFAPGQ